MGEDVNLDASGGEVEGENMVHPRSREQPRKKIEGVSKSRWSNEGCGRTRYTTEGENEKTRKKKRRGYNEGEW